MIVDHLGYVVLNSPQYNIKAFGASSTKDDNYAEIKSAIESSYRVVLIGDNTDETYNIQDTLFGVSNKSYGINGILRIKDGYVKSLETDLLIGENTLTITNASDFFKTGDHVCISSDDRSIQGGGNNKDRREGQPFTITVDGNSITLDEPADYNYLVASNAKIGHTRSNLIFDAKTKIKVFGSGIVDNNEQNQFNVEPVQIGDTYLEKAKAFYFGTGLTFIRSTYWEVTGLDENNKLKFINGATHGMSVCLSNLYFVIDSVDIDLSHDKQLLLFGYSDEKNKFFIIKNSSFKNSPYEDGITLYTQSTDGIIENNLVENCSRYGIILNPTIERVIVRNNIVKNCGQALWVGNSNNTIEDNYLEGIGHFGRVPAYKKASVYISSCNGGTLKRCTISQVDKTAQLLATYNSNNWIVDECLFDRTNDVAIVMQSSSPMTLTLRDSTLRGNATNYSVDANSTLIKENVIEE
jgi:hypothetical protein